jgi:SAM-dependent methyltransferase
MGVKYNQITANHYSAYRPPLHGAILEKVILANEEFKNGLDIGCGTGYSAVAVSKYCSHVYGVEPSDDMLEKAIASDKITYLNGSGESLPLPDKSIDIVTFAGSLFYIKSESLIEELRRVCLDQSTIIVYDFMVLLAEVLNQFNLVRKKSTSDYDCEVNFGNSIGFTEITVCKEQIELNIEADNLAHILLGNTDIYNLFAKKYDALDPFSVLVKELEKINQEWVLKTAIYYSKYKINI